MSTLSLQMGVGGKTWRPQSAPARLWAGATSVAITLLLLLALVTKPHVEGRIVGVDAKAVAVAIIAIYPPAVRHESTPIAAGPEIHRREQTQATRRTSSADASNRISVPVPLPQRGWAVQQPEVRVADAEVPKTVEQDAAASAPIRMDARTIRMANGASKSAIQLMAEHSGQDLTSTVRSNSSVLQASLGEAQLQDCIPPDAEGPGLLNLIIIPARIALNKCKFSSSR